MPNFDPLLKRLCEENGLSPEDFISDEDLYEMGQPDEKPEGAET